MVIVTVNDLNNQHTRVLLQFSFDAYIKISHVLQHIELAAS
jgi:hypothetical protein